MDDLAKADGFDFICDNIKAIRWQGPLRYCGHCDRAVIDFSAMTAAEASAARDAYAGRALCAKVSVSNAQVQHRSRRSGLRTMTLAIGLGVSGLALASWAFDSVTPTPSQVGGGANGGAAISGHGASGSELDRMQAAVESAIADAVTMRAPPAPHPMEADDSVAQIANQPEVSFAPSASAASDVPCDGVAPDQPVEFLGMMAE